MFRLAFISIFTLRVICCPLLCSGLDDVAQAFGMSETHTCSCTEADREPCQSSETPTPFDCPYPCDTGCVCQVTLELNNRTVEVDPFLTVDFLSGSSDTLDYSQAFAPRGEKLSHRIDLESGRDIRIAHASFLL